MNLNDWNEIFGDNDEELENFSTEDCKTFIEFMDLDVRVKSFKAFFNSALILDKYEDLNNLAETEVEGLTYRIKNFKEKHEGITLEDMAELNKLGYEYKSSEDVLEMTFEEEDLSFVNIIASSSEFDISDLFKKGG